MGSGARAAESGGCPVRPALLAALLLAALVAVGVNGYLRSRAKAPAPITQPAAIAQPTTIVAAIVQPTVPPTPVPTVDPERDLRVAEANLMKRLKSPATYKRVSSQEVWPESGRRFRIEFDAQNDYGGLMRECYYVPLQEGDPAAPGMTPCDVGDSLGWNR